MYRSFEELEVWKRGCQLAVRICELLRNSREFALRDQMQRAAISIPSNIAEGAERGGRDFARSDRGRRLGEGGGRQEGEGERKSKHGRCLPQV